MNEAEFNPSSVDGAPALPFIPDSSEAAALPDRIKLPATIGVERAEGPLIFVGFFIFLIGLFLGPHHSRHGHSTSPGIVSAETSLVIALGGGGLAVASALSLWAFIDDFYVLDKPSRRILIHKGLRFAGTDAPCLEAGQALAVGLDCSPIKGKYGQTGWRYTPVIVTQDGRDIQLSGWSSNLKCDPLSGFNRRTREWAAALQCHWIECPSEQAFKARDYFDGTGEPLLGEQI